MKARRTFVVIATLAILAMGVGTLMGQGTGTIQGTITDPSGAVIAQASMTARNVATGVETARQTTAAGLYVLAPLPPGEYSVTVKVAGFQTLTQEHVVVDALATISLDLVLKVGSSNEQVTVEAQATALRTADVSLGNTMQNDVYTSLPLAMGGGFGGGVPRDATQFIALSPGVATVVTQSAGSSFTSFNGGQQTTNGLYLEGLALSMPNTGGDTRPLALGVSVEAVDQFQVEVNGQKAQFQGQGFHNYQLKSGTNQFHGSVFEYFRNTALDARGFFSPYVPLDRQNEFGGSIGGPIKKDKVFFFGNYTGYRYNTATAPNFISIPSLAARNGDFSAFPQAIYDPTTTACQGAICTKSVFPDNRIPADRISSVSKSFQSYLPNPTNGNITNNYLASLPRAINNDNTTDKVDFNMAGGDRLYVVFVRGKWATDYTGNLAANGTALPLPYTGSPGTVVEVTTIGQIHHTHVFTPTLLNSFSFGAARLWIPINSTTAEGKYPQKAGLKGLPQVGYLPDAFPAISFAGANAPSAWGGNPFDEAQNNYIYQNNLQWVRGKHATTFGGQLQWMQDNDARPSRGTSSTYTFSNNDTAGFGPTGNLLTATGNGYASYLLGAVNSAAITNNNVVWAGHRYSDYSIFVQDDWKFNSRLTFNMGLRWDVYRPYAEVYGRVSFLNPDLPNPAANGRPGALVYGGDGPNNCNCSRVADTHYKNFQPRLGIALSLDSKTVLRTGFMMSYARGAAGVGGSGAGGPGRVGYNLPASYNSALTGQPAFYWEGGVPPAQSPAFLTPGFGVGFTTANPTGALSVPYVDREISGRPPYYMNWSFGLQRELPGSFTVDATYSASVGHFLPRNGDVGIWSNSMHPRFLVLQSLLNVQATPANVAAAQAIVPGIALPYSNFQGAINQMLKPFPQYSGVTCYSCSLGNSTYHSLQASVNRRFTNGFTTQFAYTLSKAIDNMPAGGFIGTVGGTRDPYNGKIDKGLGVIDRRHVLRGSFVFNLPFGKGHQLGGGNVVARALTSGWTLSGLVTFNTGVPLAVTGNGCNVPGVASSCIVSYNPAFTGSSARINGEYGSGNALQPGAISYLDRNAFINPAAYAFGNLPRSAPYGLFAPSILNQDVTLRREFAIKERWRVAIAADMFNLTNAVYFGAPVTNIDSANFGQVQTAGNAPRKIQLNARISF